MKQRKPRLIPVLDVMNGQVVRAIGGARNDYKPLVSKLTQSTIPVIVAESLLAASNATELYVADLDAIQGTEQSSVGVRNLLASTSANLVWLDEGFGPHHHVPEVFSHPNVRPVIGFETCDSPEYLAHALLSNKQTPVAFSIDLRAGDLIGDWRAWGLRSSRDALGLARECVRLGCRHLIVLDLAQVGRGTGPGTYELLKAIRSEFPRIELIAGGGVNTEDDIEHLGECGADAVLVASALHDRRLSTANALQPSIQSNPDRQNKRPDGQTD